MAALATNTEYKAYAGITGTGDDTLLTTLLGIASAQARRYCGRDETDGFESKERTEVLDGTGGATLQLSEWPVTEVDSVTEILSDGSTEVIDADDYRYASRTGVLSRLNAANGRLIYDDAGLVSAPAFGWSPCWTEGPQNWSVVYTGGWSTIPADLKFAVYRLVDWMYSSRGSNPELQSENLGAYSYTRLAMSDDADAVIVRRCLAPFKTGVL